MTDQLYGSHRDLKQLLARLDPALIIYCNTNTINILSKTQVFKYFKSVRTMPYVLSPVV